LGIFDRQDVLFDFSVSPFFIVGPNGTGKTTALKILHHILTGSWRRLHDLPFNGVVIDLIDQEVAFDRTDFRRVQRVRDLMVRAMRRPRRASLPLPASWEVAEKYLKGTHPQAAKTPRRASDSTIESIAEIYETAAPVINVVEGETVGKVLYFPTYRRVEKDLRELLEDDDDPFSETPTLTPEIVDRFETAGEVVGFGGQDIRALLETTASKIEVQAREALNEHSVRFLEALSTDQTEETKFARNVVKSQEQTDRLLARITAFSSSNINTDAISSSIAALRAKLTKPKPGRLTQQQEMLLFYVGKLLELFVKIDQLALPLRRFSDLINEYLRPVKSSYLRESDNRVVIVDRSEVEIEPDQLSSGEKQILAFFAFLLLKKELSPRFIIIDEPELHLHRALMVRLWNKLEEQRPDCIFIYITHDLDFAVGKGSELILWIKSYSDFAWNWQEVEPSGVIPNDLYLEILGSKKPILFVEGERGSLDTQIYQFIYDAYTVIPCGSCSKVIEATKGLRSHKSVHNQEVYGLIDRDTRSSEELIALSAAGIKHVLLNEVENLLLAPEILSIICEHLGKTGKIEEINSFICKEFAGSKKALEFAIAKNSLHRELAELTGAAKSEADLQELKHLAAQKIDQVL
ncbi:MAG: DUF4435 domain-containing protein, partial [Proteobacteria bacterium]